ncbi:transposase [Pseudomonas psychrophila]|nr:transposase [Pseudomonas psychrophila]
MKASLSQGVLFSVAIIMSESALIGIDLGKHTVRLHGQDKSGREVFRKKCSRAQMMRFSATCRAASWC